MTSPLRSVVASGLIASTLLGSAGAAGGGARHDLVAAFPVASAGVETAVIDFGTPGARPHLLAGWGDDAFGFAWAIGTESILEFHLAEPRELALSFRCGPLEFPGAPPQSVSFELNGHSGPRVALGAGVADYRVALPRASTRAGWNRLRLRYAWARAPREVTPNPDRRSLSVAWDYIRFDDASERPRAAPMADDAHGVLTIPPGTSVGYYLPPDPGARLSFDAIEADADTTFAVGLSDDAGRNETLARASAPMTRRWEMPVPPSRNGPVRLTLQADGGTVRLHRPVVGTASSTPPAPTSAPRGRGRPNVLVYLVDTLRADHLGCYGYGHPTSPHLDAFARDAILFTNARAESSWTRPAVASLFTGIGPPRHGVHGRPDALADGTVTMARLLRGARYATAGFVTNANVAPLFGFGQGFEQYELLPGALMPDPNGVVAAPLPGSGRLTARARHWLRERTGDRPFFLYLHAADPHGPYTPPADFRRRFGVADDAADIGSLEGLRRLQADARPPDEKTTATLVSLYDAEVAHNDRQFGRLVAHLRRQGLYDDTLVVFLADHGEEFHEHGAWEHGKSLYDEVLHVPLLIKLPGRAYAGTRVDAPAQLDDILPSLLAQLGLPVPNGLDGADLLATLGSSAPEAARATFSHLALDGYVSDAIEDRGWKLITGWGGGELFDRRRDPGERVNAIGKHLETTGWLRTRLAERLAGPGLAAALAGAPSGDVLRNLRALGYVE